MLKATKFKEPESPFVSLLDLGFTQFFVVDADQGVDYLNRVKHFVGIGRINNLAPVGLIAICHG